MKRKRAPGAGRKPLLPSGPMYNVTPIRFPSDLYKQISDVVAQRGGGHSVSAEIRWAVRYWLKQLEDPDSGPSKIVSEVDQLKNKLGEWK